MIEQVCVCVKKANLVHSAVTLFAWLFEETKKLAALHNNAITISQQQRQVS